jgi:hypothetical protein
VISLRTQKILVLVLVVGLCALVYSVTRAVDRQSKKDGVSHLNSQQDVSSYTIYVPSPVERVALNRIALLWPQKFSVQNPLVASKLPHFYRTLFESSERDTLQLGAAQMAMVRSWSMDANTASIDSLKRSLITPIDQIFGEYSDRADPLEKIELKSLAQILKQSSGVEVESECSLLRQERLFRIAQAWPEFQADAAARYQNCVGAEDLISVWFDLNAMLFSNQSGSSPSPELSASIGQRLDAIQQRGSPFDAHLAERLSQAAFLKATH